jgi:sodium/bile acid cotransporter 7
MINGTLSNLIGILLTPLLIYLQLHNSISLSAMASTLIRLTEVCLAPFVLGQGIRLFLHWRGCISKQTALHLAKLRIVPKVVLIWLTYTSFCTTFESQVTKINGGAIGLSLALLTVIHLIMIGFVILYLFVFDRIGYGFTRPTVVAHLFVGTSLWFLYGTFHVNWRWFLIHLGTEKTMTLAIPIVQILYGSNGIVLIPIIAYHSIETIIGGILLIPLRRWVKKENNVERDSIQ